jgi:hypothetical protein
MCVLGFNSKNKSRSIGFFPFKAHLTQRVKWAIAFTSPPLSSFVVIHKLLHFNFLLWNHWANWNQSWYECLLDGPLQSLWFFFIDQNEVN